MVSDRRFKLQEAVRAGETEESDSLGHSMMEYAPARAVQRRYQAYAAGNIPLLRNVLRNSGDGVHRALAGGVLFREKHVERDGDNIGIAKEVIAIRECAP